MIAETYTPVRITHDHALVREWELVLASQGLSPHVGESLDGFVLSVPEHESELALAALAAYDQEKFLPTRESIESAAPIDLSSGIIAGELLVIFFLVVNFVTPALPWSERGSADAQSILNGEVWRTVTALTLHADLGHVLSNAAAAAIFFSAVNNLLGVGLGSVLLLLAGALGNYANAWMYGAFHVSIGASTAVFGAVGMLGVLGMSKRRRTSLVARRKWLSVAAALALLAMLGTAGQRVDLFAHLFGFAAGGALAAALAIVSHRVPGKTVQTICGVAAIAGVLWCWYRALG